MRGGTWEQAGSTASATNGNHIIALSNANEKGRETRPPRPRPPTPYPTGSFQISITSLSTFLILAIPFQTLHYWLGFAGTRIWGRRETIQEKRKEIERGRKREDGGWEGKRERREWWQTTSFGRTQTSLTPPDAVRYSLSTLKSKTSSALTLSLSSRFVFFFFFFFFFQIWLNVVQSIVLVLEKVLLCLLHRPWWSCIQRLVYLCCSFFISTLSDLQMLVYMIRFITGWCRNKLR